MGRELSPVEFSYPIRVSGEALAEGKFRFSCGLEVPLKEIEWLCDPNPQRMFHLELGSRVSFDILNVHVSDHAHEFRCKCGATK